MTSWEYRSVIASYRGLLILPCKTRDNTKSWLKQKWNETNISDYFWRAFSLSLEKQHTHTGQVHPSRTPFSRARPFFTKRKWNNNKTHHHYSPHSPHALTHTHTYPSIQSLELWFPRLQIDAVSFFFLLSNYFDCLKWNKSDPTQITKQASKQVS